MKEKQDYLNMQESYYEGQAARWTLDNKDPVVSWYHEHQAWKDYDTCLFRMKNVENFHNWVVLDYGCGPGRSMIRYKDWFKQIDGVDIASGNLDKAVVNLKDAGLPIPNLYKNNGKDLQGINDGTYDCVFSVICLQHICSHSIRVNIMEEIYRVLKSGGYFCAQMGFGSTHLTPYYMDFYDAQGTNGAADVGFDNQDLLKADLEDIGFHDYSSVVRPPCQDQHPYWLWFQARKP